VDCERFDRVVLDLLYGELDELTAAAARRHMEHCARCGPIGSGLRATREVGVLPMLDPPADLAERIVNAERQAHARLPLRARVGRAVSVLAGYAMRPQLAMAALLLLVLASSLLLLRARPGDRDAMRVTERGVPEIEGEAVIIPVPDKTPPSNTALGLGQVHEPLRERGARAAPRESADQNATQGPGAASASEMLADGKRPGESAKDPQAARADTDAFNEAMVDYHARRYERAQRAFEAIESAGGGNAPSAALFAGQSLRGRSGCTAAAPRLEVVAAQYPGTSVAHEATWQAASCYQELGQLNRARQGFLALRSTPAYRQRAQQALDSLDRSASRQELASRRAAARAKPAPPAETSASKETKPQNTAPAAPASDKNALGF
jgi:hypothetical protein